jgi:hypothetical protein
LNDEVEGEEKARKKLEKKAAYGGRSRGAGHRRGSADVEEED